jgi:hypothetical protein
MNGRQPSTRRSLLIATLVFAATLNGSSWIAGGRALAQTIPSELTDREFWRISSESSEEDGTFRSDNLLSNEFGYQYILAELNRTVKPGRIYMGVGPEQNFTYIAATKPKMVFIVDIRRGNLDLQLMYKAIFELSSDRAEFVSRLFSRNRPQGLTRESSAVEIFDAFAKVQPLEAVYKQNLETIIDHLSKKHGFPLSEIDRAGIEYVYDNFYRFGPDITYNSSQGGFGGGGNRVSYADLMTAGDERGEPHSYLANEQNFAFLKELETRNLMIPVVGNFAGPKALRAVGQYLKGLDATVSTFYLSNVEDYLNGSLWTDFCRNASALPLDPSSTFIRTARGFGGGGMRSQLGNMLMNLSDCKE